MLLQWQSYFQYYLPIWKTDGSSSKFFLQTAIWALFEFGFLVPEKKLIAWIIYMYFRSLFKTLFWKFFEKSLSMVLDVCKPHLIEGKMNYLCREHFECLGKFIVWINGWTRYRYILQKKKVFKIVMWSNNSINLKIQNFYKPYQHFKHDPISIWQSKFNLRYCLKKKRKKKKKEPTWKSNGIIKQYIKGVYQYRKIFIHFCTFNRGHLFLPTETRKIKDSRRGENDGNFPTKDRQHNVSDFF
jgi:hypothetical protein